MLIQDNPTYHPSNPAQTHPAHPPLEILSPYCTLNHQPTKVAPSSSSRLSARELHELVPRRLSVVLPVVSSSEAVYLQTVSASTVCSSLFTCRRVLLSVHL